MTDQTEVYISKKDRIKNLEQGKPITVNSELFLAFENAEVYKAFRNAMEEGHSKRFYDDKGTVHLGLSIPVKVTISNVLEKLDIEFRIPDK